MNRYFRMANNAAIDNTATRFSQTFRCSMITCLETANIKTSKLVRTTDGLEATENGVLIIDENYMTTREGVFAAGDVVTGAKTVVHAVEGAKIAARKMIDYMKAADEKGLLL